MTSESLGKMRVVKCMDEQKHETEEQKPAGKYIQLKPFTFIMVLFLLIVVTAGLTIFALTFGDERVVEVKVPVERAEFAQLYDAYDELKAKYYTEINEQEVVNGAINGMFDALGDPYTDYMNKEEAQSFNDSLSSSFQGIGAEIQERNGYIMVVSPIKNSPAEAAGLQPKDLILTVDGESIKGLNASEAVLLIRGEKGTKVTLEVQRGDNPEPLTFTIVRDDIPVETVYGELDAEKIAHIQITSFSEETAAELEAMLADFDEQGMTGIVLDVRQNPGGYLEAAIDISNLFVPAGKNILQLQGRDGEPQALAAKAGDKYTLPVTVLIDEGSASASEILAAALSESYGAKVVGVSSFGKGTMQEVSYFDDGANLKFTTGKWLTPSGQWINEKGVTPDVEVPYPPYAQLAYVDPAAELTTGTEREAVASVEGMLEALGYDPGEVDNTFTAQTAAAVKQFQKAQELEQTGIVANETTYALMDAIREKMQQEDPQLVEAKKLLTAE